MLALLAALMAAIALSVAPAAAYAEDAGVAVWRLYNQWSGEHLFTTDKGEYDSLQGLGWSGEGKAWDAPSEGDEVFRLYNPYSGDHHYTMDKDEYGHLGEIGWRQEGGVLHSADASSGTPIYRLFNRWLTQGTHLFTTDKGEYDNLGQIGWQQEGIAFYAMGGSGGPYTVRFVSWDDSQGKEVTVSEQVLAAGERISIPDAPVRTDKDYEFRGWDGVYDGMRCSGSFTSRALWAPTAPEEIEAPAGTVVEELSFAPDVMCGEGEVEYLDDGELPSWLAGAAGAEGISASSGAGVCAKVRASDTLGLLPGAGVCAKVRASDTLGLLPGRVYIVNRGDFLNGAAMIVEEVRECPGEPFYRIVIGRVADQLTDVVDSLHIKNDGSSINPEKDIELKKTEDGDPVAFKFSKDTDGRLTLSTSLEISKLGKTDRDYSAFDEATKRLAKILDGKHEKEERSTEASGSFKAEIKATPRFEFNLQKGKIPIQTMVLDKLDATVSFEGEAKGEFVQHLGYAKIGIVIVDIDAKVKADGTADIEIGIEDSRLGYDQTGDYPNKLGKQKIGDGEFEGKGSAGLHIDAIIGIYGIASGDADIGADITLTGKLTKHQNPSMTCADFKLAPSIPLTLTGTLWNKKWEFTKNLIAGLDGLKIKIHLEDEGNGLKETSECTWGDKVIFKDGKDGEILKVVEHSAGDRLLKDAPDLEKDGYVCLGWKREGSSSDEPIASDATFSERIFLVPIWKRGGTFGDGCTWSLSDDGTLTVSPADGESGTMSPLYKALDGKADMSKIKKVVIAKGVEAPKDSTGLFEGIDHATSIDAGYLNVSNVTNMSGMFKDCSSLEDLKCYVDDPNMNFGMSTAADADPDASIYVPPEYCWDTSSVTDMSDMFYGCSSLTGISGISYWDTPSLENMNQMFLKCSSLSTLSNGFALLNTSRVTDMGGVFYGCTALGDISAISRWDVSSVTAMNGMFDNCSSLTDFSALSSWDVSSVKNMDETFKDCAKVKDLSALSGWNTSTVQDMDSMFSGCASLKDLSGLSRWKVSSVEFMGNMFSDCEALTGISGISGWDTKSVLDMQQMFDGCTSLADASSLSGWDTSSVTSKGDMFAGTSIPKDKLPSWY